MDVSVYDGIKIEVENLLGQYPEQKCVDAVLFVVDDEAIKALHVLSQRLSMEYGGDDTIYAKFKLSTLVKVINFEKPCSWYKTFEAESWKQVNDKEKVLQRLDSEFSKYKNKIKSFTLKKIKDNKIPKKQEALIMNDIEAEIIQGKKKLDYIQENFETLDVRISTYHERTKYAGVQYIIHKKREPNQSLRKQVPNVLWFKEASKAEKVHKDNELVVYLEHAKRAFGDVYFVELDTYTKPSKEKE